MSIVRAGAARIALLVVLPLSVAIISAQSGQRANPPTAGYFPDRFEWQQQTPEQARFDAAKLDAAVKFAVASENSGNKDLAWIRQNAFNEFIGQVIGATTPSSR